MQKNEGTLLRPFLRYHAALFGAENIYVVDNGSTDLAVIGELAAAEREGVCIERTHGTIEDYLAKGNIIGDLVKRLDQDEKYDFYILLDCDEFVVLRQGNGYTCDQRSINKYLDRLVGERRILRVTENLSNVPGRPGLFQSADYSKTIFPGGVLLATDHGHHVGESLTGAGYIQCDIVYAHFHFRPYEEILKFARQKLSVEMPIEHLDDPDKLRSFTGRGYHMVGYMLDGPEKYYEQFRRLNKPVVFTELLDRFLAVGSSAPFSDFALPGLAADQTDTAPSPHQIDRQPLLVLDEATDTRIRGWAIYQDAPTEPLSLRFYVGETLVWNGLAIDPDLTYAQPAMVPIRQASTSTQVYPR